MEDTKYIALVDWPKYHAWPPIGGLRHLVFTMPPGFENVIRRVGRRVLINERRFFQWVESNPTK